MHKFISLTSLMNGKPVMVNVNNIDYISTDTAHTCYILFTGTKLYVEQSYEQVISLINTQEQQNENKN